MHQLSEDENYVMDIFHFIKLQNLPYIFLDSLRMREILFTFIEWKLNRRRPRVYKECLTIEKELHKIIKTPIIREKSEIRENY